MSANFQKLQEAILSSNIPFEDREKFLMLFAQFNDNQLDVVVELFSYKEWIEKMYNNYKEKELAAKNRDWGAWKRILDDEEDVLKSMQDVSVEAAGA